MLVKYKNPQGYKEHVISFIEFSFGEVINITDWILNMKLYVSNIEELYKDTIIGDLVSSGAADLLLHIVQCWSACAVNEEKRDPPMVIYCSVRMYKYYSSLGLFQIKYNERVKDIQN